MHLKIPHHVERDANVNPAELGVSSRLDELRDRLVREEWRVYQKRWKDGENGVQS